MASAQLTYRDSFRDTVLCLRAMHALISSHALSVGRALVTNNEKEFVRVLGLKVENWAV